LAAPTLKNIRGADDYGMDINNASAISVEKNQGRKQIILNNKLENIKLKKDPILKIDQIR